MGATPMQIYKKDIDSEEYSRRAGYATGGISSAPGPPSLSQSVRERISTTAMTARKAAESSRVPAAYEPPSVPFRSLRPRMTTRMTVATDETSQPKKTLPSTNQRTSWDVRSRLSPLVKTQVTTGRKMKRRASST